MEEKEVEKGEKGKKWFWEKSFLFLFDCVFASSFFPLHPSHHHATTHAHHTPPTFNMTHWCTITCKQGCVLCCLFWEWTARHTASFTPHTPSLDITQHTPTNPTKTQLMVQATKDDNCKREGDWTKGKKVGQHSSNNTLIEVATTQWL